MKNELTDFEKFILKASLHAKKIAGENRTRFAKQIQNLELRERHYTGCGFWTYVTVKNCDKDDLLVGIRVLNCMTIRTTEGTNFILLYFENGCLGAIEGVVSDSINWPYWEKDSIDATLEKVVAIEIDDRWFGKDFLLTLDEKSSESSS